MTARTAADLQREMVLRGYLAVALATLGPDPPPAGLLPALLNLLTHDLARLLHPPQADLTRPPSDGGPVTIPVRDPKNGQTIYFTIGGNPNE